MEIKQRVENHMLRSSDYGDPNTVDGFGVGDYRRRQTTSRELQNSITVIEIQIVTPFPKNTI
jgi:hypothetical protein